MTPFSIGAAVTATALVASFVFGRLFGPTITTEINIDAPSDVVWSVLADTAAYEDWNPFVRKISGDVQPGNRVSITVGAPGSKPMDFSPRILVADPGAELRWIGHLGVPGLFDGEHFFVLQDAGDGRTQLIHGERFTGVLVYPIMKMIGGETRAGFKAMNAALKTRAEAMTL